MDDKINIIKEVELTRDTRVRVGETELSLLLLVLANLYHHVLLLSVVQHVCE